jgi:phenylacetate-CoA ligase
LKLRVGHNPAVLATDAAELNQRLCKAIRDTLDLPVEIDLVLDEDLLKLGPPQKIPRITTK